MRMNLIRKAEFLDANEKEMVRYVYRCPRGHACMRTERYPIVNKSEEWSKEKFVKDT